MDPLFSSAKSDPRVVIKLFLNWLKLITWPLLFSRLTQNVNKEILNKTLKAEFAAKICC